MTDSGGTRGFAWKSDAGEGVLTIALYGEFDLAATQHADWPTLEQLFERDERVIVVDLRDVTFMDSSGLRVLVSMRNEVDKRGASLLLGRVSEPVERVLEVSGLTDWFVYVEGEPREL